MRCNLFVFCFYIKDLPVAFKQNILVHSCSWPLVMFLEVELVFSDVEVLFCWIPVHNAFNFQLCYIKVQWGWISVFISLPVKLISFICLPMGGRKKRMVCVGGSDLIGTHDRNKQEEISCFLSFMFLCFWSSRFSSRVLSSSQNDAISSSEEHVPCQCIICCQLQQKALPLWNHLGSVATAGVCLPHVIVVRHSWFLWWHLDIR